MSRKFRNIEEEIEPDEEPEIEEDEDEVEVDTDGEVEPDEEEIMPDDEVEVKPDEEEEEITPNEGDTNAGRAVHKSAAASRKNKREKAPKPSRGNQKKPDLRRQLFNQGKVGVIEAIQVSTERIVQLNGILFDIDPQTYVAGPLTQGISRDPGKFYNRILRTWLKRSPILTNCEVRVSGTGLHAILWIKPPVKFETTGDRQRWAGIVKVVQAALPIDPDQPGITATTRALGSVNSKNGSKVRQLAKGRPVTEEQVQSLFDTMCSAPFKTVFNILTGDDSVSPCPICDGEGTKLSALDYAGRCYGSCGTVELETLYDLVLAPRPAQKEKRQDAKKIRKAK